MHSLFNYFSVKGIFILVGIFILISGLCYKLWSVMVFSFSYCTFTNDLFECNLFLEFDDFNN